MTLTFILTLLPFAGLAVALTKPRSLWARTTGVGLAVMIGGFALVNILAAHRLAEESPPEAISRSSFEEGVERMRTIVRPSILLLLAAGTVLAMIALVPYEPDRGSKARS